MTACLDTSDLQELIASRSRSYLGGLGVDTLPSLDDCPVWLCSSLASVLDVAVSRIAGVRIRYRIVDREGDRQDFYLLVGDDGDGFRWRCTRWTVTGPDGHRLCLKNTGSKRRLWHAMLGATCEALSDA